MFAYVNAFTCVSLMAMPSKVSPFSLSRFSLICARNQKVSVPDIYPHCLLQWDSIYTYPASVLSTPRIPDLALMGTFGF